MWLFLQIAKTAKLKEVVLFIFYNSIIIRLMLKSAVELVFSVPSFLIRIFINKDTGVFMYIYVRVEFMCSIWGVCLFWSRI